MVAIVVRLGGLVALTLFALAVGPASAAGTGAIFVSHERSNTIVVLDPATYAVVAIFFTLVSLTAAFAAARHAASADPVVALRSE